MPESSLTQAAIHGEACGLHMYMGLPGLGIAVVVSRAHQVWQFQAGRGADVGSERSRRPDMGSLDTLRWMHTRIET